MDAYETRPGAAPDDCGAGRQLLAGGHMHAIAFSSTAEASPCWKALCTQCKTTGLLACWPAQQSQRGFIHTQTQGLVLSMGGADALQDMVHQNGVLLAAYGPYTAAGVRLWAIPGSACIRPPESLTPVST